MSSPASNKLSVRVIVFPEGNYLVAQCLEHDIAAQGTNMQELREAFAQTFFGHIKLAIDHNQKPFANLGKAPSRYWKLWETGNEFKEPLSLKAPSQYQVPLQLLPKQAVFAIA